MYRTALGAFEQVNPHFLQAAQTLGASDWRLTRDILLPLAWPGVMAGTVLAFARALREFGATLMLAGNIPGRTQTVPVAIFFAAEGGEMSRASGWVLIIVAIALAVIATLNYWSRYQQMPGTGATGGRLCYLRPNDRPFSPVRSPHGRKYHHRRRVPIYACALKSPYHLRSSYGLRLTLELTPLAYSGRLGRGKA